MRSEGPSAAPPPTRPPPPTGAHAVWGVIRGRWQNLGWERASSATRSRTNKSTGNRSPTR
ncbi:hypothetical protein [Actinomadura flavalba]|uniref:hypothetical protein n=1 Tax=Actinomadura flavalba TaxID=1120938 RepID=UPI0030844506